MARRKGALRPGGPHGQRGHRGTPCLDATHDAQLTPATLLNRSHIFNTTRLRFTPLGASYPAYRAVSLRCLPVYREPAAADSSAPATISRFSPATLARRYRFLSTATGVKGKSVSGPASIYRQLFTGDSWVKPTHGSLSTDGCETSCPQRRAAQCGPSSGAAGNRTRHRICSELRKHWISQRESTRNDAPRPADTPKSVDGINSAFTPLREGPNRCTSVAGSASPCERLVGDGRDGRTDPRSPVL
jgi:hypothetical protein